MNKITALLSTSLLATVTTNATIISLHNFNASAPNLTTPTLADSANASNVTVTAISGGSGLATLSDGLYNNANAYNFSIAGDGQYSLGGTSNAGIKFSDMNNADNLSLAVTNNEYLSFSVTPGANYALDFTSLTFQMRSNNLNNGAEHYAVFSSIGGFSSTSNTVNDAIAIGSISTAGTYELKTINLSSLTGITSATEFRIYMYGADAPYSGFTGFDNITLNGELLPVPEPSSTALLGLGGLALLMRRRK